MNSPAYSRAPRLRYSDVAYYIWFVLAVMAYGAAFWCVMVGEWGWVLGWTVGGLALSAHARLERFEGHRHHNGIEVP